MTAIDRAKELDALKPKAAKKKRFTKHLVHLFLLPSLLFYVGFMVYPIFQALLNSFFSWKGLVRGDFIGLQNFIRLFTESPFKETFSRALGHNVIYFVGTMVFKLVIAFALAMMINSKIKGKELFKALFFLPKLLSVIVVGYLFSLILNPSYGALNQILTVIGLESWARPWLGDPKTALNSIILVNSWYGFGFAMLIFLVGLQAISTEIYEAARIDGASGWTMIFKITIPLAMPSIMIMTILTFIGAFETFELIFAMQGSSGSPYFSTDVLGLYFYRLAFGSVSGGDSIGLGSALAVVLLILISGATAISMFFFKRKEVEH
ncbi:carbohydrate ABC transporter permease [Paenibacillus allorhizosphaerae]|uniref:Melibiose/raffinose/stachyose import permease protein MelD n=1 Tax=Paenibacillus allorhizosphaerae TaxID=2849866 RepID=A0ABM8VHV2_9BACL|nr:sugar ABC transporter permease [Paenibacillus allorhizosphaerae]CAG7643158.1 Melibiose/raffinose/stachyose import permease protein MelD [Paenibacillus allorhizosphaerae]